MKGKLSPELILVLLSFVISLGVAIFFFWSSKEMFKRPDIDIAKEQAALKEAAKKILVPENFAISKMIMNLPTKTNRLRFLNLSINYVPFNNSQIKFLDENKHVLKDIIIDIGNTMYPEELNSISGKILFEERIKAKTNELLGPRLIKEIYFSSFVFQ